MSPHQPKTAASPTRALLATRYRAVREATLGLAGSLAVEDQVVQPCEEASPTKWHLGHTTWFFERFVLAAPAYAATSPSTIVTSRSSTRTTTRSAPCIRARDRGTLSRPTVAQIHDYRSRIDDALLDLLESRPDDAELADLVELGLNHEEQHQELLLTDAKQVLFASPLDVAYCATAAPPRAAATVPLEFRFEPAGFARDRRRPGGFAFDNERPRHREWLEAHSLANRLVTNGEYREFIRADGYTTPDLWLADGWTTVGRAAGIDRSAGRRISSASTRSAAGAARRRTRPFATSASTRRRRSPRGRGHGCPRRPSGRTPRRRHDPSTAICASTGWLHPAAARRAAAMRHRAAALGRRLGMVRVGVSSVPALPAARRARSASTTASSCAISGSPAAGRASRRRATCARAIEISFIRTIAGSSWEFGSRRTPSPRRSWRVLAAGRSNALQRSAPWGNCASARDHRRRRGNARRVPPGNPRRPDGARKNGCRRSISTTSAARSSSTRSARCPSTIRRERSSACCAPLPRSSLLSSGRARRSSSSAPDRA